MASQRQMATARRKREKRTPGHSIQERLYVERAVASYNEAFDALEAGLATMRRDAASLEPRLGAIEVAFLKRRRRARAKGAK